MADDGSLLLLPEQDRARWDREKIAEGFAALERAELTGEWDAVNFAWRKVVKLRLRYLERVPLGTPYTEVVERVAQVTRSGALRGCCHLAVDGTGVGRPVVDLRYVARQTRSAFDFGCSLP